MNATVKVLCYKSKTLSNGEHRISGFSDQLIFRWEEDES